MRISYQLISGIIKFLMKVIWNLQIINRENSFQIKNCIIAANHISFFDPPFIGSVIPLEIYFLAKAELFKSTMMNFFFHFLNAIPIRRGTIDRNASAKIEEILSQGHSLLMFPEGTRKNVKVKAGIGKIAFQLQKDIIPVQIVNSDDLKSCFLRKKKLQIIFGDKIPITSFSGEDTKTTYQQIAKYTMDTIYGLKYEHKNS